MSDLLEDGPFTSKDVDFLHNSEAETALTRQLGGKLILPKGDDHTPNAALFVGEIGDKRLEIDFMRAILGVDAEAIRTKYVRVEVARPEGPNVDVLLMHPLHCFQSRLANIDILRRRDAVTLRQMRAALVVLKAFIDELLSLGEFREAQDTLRDFFYTLVHEFYGGAAHLEFNLRPETVLSAFADDERLDVRWRANQLSRFIDRADQARLRLIAASD